MAGDVVQMQRGAAYAFNINESARSAG